MNKQILENKKFTGERALFGSKNLIIKKSKFYDGESPLKESRGIDIFDSEFHWKYPLWYCKNINVKNTIWFEIARAGVWYTDNLLVENCLVEAPKNFRRCNNISIINTSIPNAQETLWSCNDVSLKNVVACGPYFCMNSNSIKVDSLSLFGDYSFDGCKNVEITNSKLLSKDAFWNSDNVTVYNSYISGEYLGWNSKNLTLIDCTIESLQGLCYIDNLVMKNCKLINTTLAFEYSSVDADISSSIDSVINPKAGTIKCDSIDELIIEKDKVDPTKTKIICNGI